MTSLVTKLFVLVLTVIVLALGATTACAPQSDATDEPAAWPPPAPPTGQGMQFKVGPYEVPPGGEIHKCVTYQVEESMLVKRIESFSSGPSHHFAADVTVVPVPDGVFDCTDVFTSNVMANSMTVYSTDRAQNRIDFPDGVAGKLPATFAKIILSYHAVNPSKEARSLEGYLNLFTTERENVRTLVNGLVASVANFGLPPRSDTAITGTCTIDRAVDVIAMTGHAHQQLASFELRLIRGGVRPEQPDYSTLEWSGPPLDTRTEHPIHLEAGDAIEWRCNYRNGTDAEITEGESTSQEMCMAVVVYMPDQGFLTCRVTPAKPKGGFRQQTPASAL